MKVSLVRGLTLTLFVAALTSSADGQQTVLPGVDLTFAVGSTEGAGGSRFRTSVIISGSFKGRLVFHPAGRPAAVDDPFLAVNRSVADPNSTFEYPDVVQAMGASGVGALDVVPDADCPLGCQVGETYSVLARICNDKGLARIIHEGPIRQPGSD